MKKLLIVSLLLCGIVLGWCSLQKWLSQDELFEKKQECLSYQTNILENINRGDILMQIFYSPKINSCLYITKNVISINDTTYYIYDYFENVLVSSTHFYETLEKKIKELKWE